MKKGKYIKSPLNYTGGKYKLLSQILPLFPDNIRYFVDMFTGGVNVGINVNAEKIIANDNSAEVIGIYKRLQNASIEEVLAHIERRIEEYHLSMENQEGYNSFRTMYNTSDKDPLDLFILVCYSFNHQIRFNKDGNFNMPFGKNRSAFNKTIKKNLTEFHEAIKNIRFTVNDFADIKTEALKDGDFVYCDPPYLITCASYNEQDGWNETQERRLLSLLDELNSMGVKFALSNVIENKGKVNSILKEWTTKYNVHHLSNTYSNCSYHAKDRDKTTTDEVLITNY